MKTARNLGFVGTLFLVLALPRTGTSAQDRSDSPLETLREFQKMPGPDPKISKTLHELRDRFAAELKEARPQEGKEVVYYATLPYYVMALAAMDEAVVVVVDYGAMEDEEERKELQWEYQVLQAELEILSAEIRRLERELGA